MKNTIKQIKWVLVTLSIFGATFNTIAQEQNWLSVSGNKLFDSEGEEVRLTGVNWFGFETSLYSPHGIWTRDMKSVLRQIKDLGFNTIRVPWCNEMLNPGSTININSFGTDPYTGVSPMNEEESKLTKPIELMDVMVQWCQDNNIKIVLDNHSRAADGFLNEALWYTNQYSENRWINDWVFLAERYKDFSAVVAMDLNNEPHGSTWGNSNPATDWNKAAERCGNAILEVNPNVLIIVEGVGEFEGNSYWWGGQLMGARKYPVQLSDPHKLMYSAHEYGPEVFNQDWFGAANFPQNMPGIWRENFHYLYEEEISPIFAGEFGIRNQGAFGGTAYTWFTEWMNFMGDIYSWTFWTMNPNSGDTGGILKDDWFSVNQWKMDVLQPHFAPLIPNTIGGINLPPIARFTNDVSSGDVPLTVQFDASTSSDPENDPLSYSWDFGDGTTATGDIILHTFANVGSYNVTLTVSDTAGNSSTLTDIIIVTEPGNGDPCDFGAPLANPLPSITNATYTKVHILGVNGPDLSNMAGFNINWDLPNNGLWQLSMNTTNGIPNWWNDLKSKITSQNLNASNPSITLSDTGFPDLDDSYYVTLDDQNFVLVSKSRNVTIYFSNSDVVPVCEVAKEKKVLNELRVDTFPNPVLDKIMIQGDPSMRGLSVYIMDVKGKVIKNSTLNSISGRAMIDVSECNPGVYFVKVLYEKGMITKQIIKK